MVPGRPTALAVPVFPALAVVLVPVLARGEQYEIADAVVPLVVVAVVHLHPCGYRADLAGVHVPVQQTVARAPVVVVRSGVPRDAVVTYRFPVFPHVKIVSVGWTSETGFQPSAVATLWSGVSHVGPASWS
jgi:hypothetical protein